MALKLLAICGVLLALVGAFTLQAMPDARWHSELAIAAGVLLLAGAWIAHWKR